MGTIDGPIALPQPALPFDELARLREQSREIKDAAVVSLENYRDDASCGFFHLLEPDTKGNVAGNPSRASSATVICFLVRTGRWPEVIPDGTDPAEAAQRLIDEYVTDGPWTSAGLDDDNPFTVAFLLEVVAVLTDVGGQLSDKQKEICKQKLGILRTELDEGPGGPGRISISGEVANSYLTDLVGRVLSDWSNRALTGPETWISDATQESLWDGAISAVNEQLALLGADGASTGGPEPDIFELGYATLLAAKFAGNRLSPEKRSLLRAALRAVFAAQREDGGWPRSRRLFRYPDYGDAYCYDFEFLARMIRSFSEPGPRRNSKALLPYLPNLQRSISRLTRDAIELPQGGYGWSSGHHRAFVFPESWSTASAFDVAELVDRFVTDAITTTIVDHLDQTSLVWDPTPSSEPFDDLLDARVRWSVTTSPVLKPILRDSFLVPIQEQAKELEEGKPLKDGTAVSLLLYGPPGTSKTTYAKAIARFLGWRLLTVDPSHLLRSGFDNIHLEINTLFRMLSYAERVVVFFDEIDELVRDRSTSSAEAVSRFLTTSMLPKIVKLRDSRRMVFMVATNHIEVFDPAIARPGRFDLVLPVMPPTTEEKLKKWSDLGTALANFGFASSKSQHEQLEQLTYDELDLIRPRLVDAKDAGSFSEMLKQAAQDAIINQQISGRETKETWRELMKNEESRIRPRA